MILMRALAVRQSCQVVRQCTWACARRALLIGFLSFFRDSYSFLYKAFLRESYPFSRLFQGNPTLFCKRRF